jgi:Ca2+-binding EF-hand superfamily protein
MPRSAERGPPARPMPVLALALSALLLAAAPASGRAQLPASPLDYLASMDLDDDGRIDLAEYRAWMSRGFLRMDLDGNGTLEGDELPVAGARPVTWASHRSALAAAFGRQDHDGDGVLDAAELAAPPR